MPGPAPRPFITRSQLHLIGLILDDYHDNEMFEDGYTTEERRVAGELFAAVDKWLTSQMGAEWNDEEVL